ncbi:MAG: hypothetical protein PHO02_06985 [Candidatus Nanoarchaeia archaeon]|nr:hypothetical protein [Candidatus Nanoarchaeia archaeon]
MKGEENRSGFRFTWAMVLIIATVILLTVFFAYYFGLVKKNCDTEECFQEELQKCGMSTYSKVHNYNYYTYTIKGASKGECRLNIKLAKMAAGTSPDKIELFEGKDMECRIPMTEVEGATTEQINTILKYCTGPLKEAMYEQIIEKLYTIVVGNLGEIIGSIEDTLNKGP